VQIKVIAHLKCVLPCSKQRGAELPLRAGFIRTWCKEASTWCIHASTQCA